LLTEGENETNTQRLREGKEEGRESKKERERLLLLL
jgi:hypothetical protein